LTLWLADEKAEPNRPQHASEIWKRPESVSARHWSAHSKHRTEDCQVETLRRNGEVLFKCSKELEISLFFNAKRIGKVYSGARWFETVCREQSGEPTPSSV
jgi:hypothetical protein